MKTLLTRSFEESFSVEIIYQGKNNQFTKRTILVKAINDTYIKAYCHSRRQVRIFRIEMILAVSPVRKKRNRYA